MKWCPVSKPREFLIEAQATVRFLATRLPTVCVHRRSRRSTSDGKTVVSAILFGGWQTTAGRIHKVRFEQWFKDARCRKPWMGERYWCKPVSAPMRRKSTGSIGCDG